MCRVLLAVCDTILLRDNCQKYGTKVRQADCPLYSNRQTKNSCLPWWGCGQIQPVLGNGRTTAGTNSNANVQQLIVSLLTRTEQNRTDKERSLHPSNRPALGERRRPR